MENRVNCEAKPPVKAWDSLAFERIKTWSSLSEWATGYEKAGLCAARVRQARKAPLCSARRRTVCQQEAVFADQFFDG